MFSNLTQGSNADHSTVDVLADISDGPHPDSMPWDTSDPFFSASARIFLQRVLKCYIRQFIVFVGIPGNIVCCVVFFKQGLRDRIQLLLFWLAVADLTNLTAQLWLMPGCYLQDRVHVTNWAVVANTYIGYVNRCSSYVSGTLIVIVSLDRCVSVAAPFKAKEMINYRMMVAAIVLSFLVPLMFFLPRFLAFNVKWTVDPSTNRSIAYTAETHWFPMDTKFVIELIDYFTIITKPISLIIVIICCIITVVHLRHASRQREQMTGQIKDKGESGDNRIPKTLLILCFIYVIFILPETCSACVVRFVPEFYPYRRYHNTFIVVMQFLWIASCVNSAANVVVYIVLSSRFQRTLRELCGCFGCGLVKSIPVS